mmetsp:Transcript_86172/g.278429  ORF Transcript_86172/g.278429 Transcript_86172/m.278429 type:complete len:322 (-) Transcript_86172:45-1010(-)
MFSRSTAAAIRILGRREGPQARNFGAAAAFGTAGAATWGLSAQRERATRCEADPAVVGAAVLGTAVGALGGFFYGKSKADAVQEKYATYWPRKIMMVFGAPGAGKGTQGPKIVDMLDIPQLSTGDMLREAVAAGTEIGKKAKDVMASGALVSDDIVIGIIADRIKADDCKNGFILDGFPRTVAQSKALDAMLATTGEAVSLVMAFDVDPAVLEERVCGRWIDKASGRSYHVKFAAPKSMKVGHDGKPIPDTMKDDITGDKLFQRPDDTAEALKKRLDGYKNQTVPILDHYAPRGIVKNIDGGAPIAAVWAEVKAKLANGTK